MKDWLGLNEGFCTFCCPSAVNSFSCSLSRVFGLFAKERKIIIVNYGRENDKDVCPGAVYSFSINLCWGHNLLIIFSNVESKMTEKENI